jgi:hypothetical protein
VKNNVRMVWCSVAAIVTGISALGLWISCIWTTGATSSHLGSTAGVIALLTFMLVMIATFPA